tara:strand:+ start:152 stop:526 length:375 start_codon:yes stop_codon:yes gene_type:complete
MKLVKKLEKKLRHDVTKWDDISIKELYNQISRDNHNWKDLFNTTSSNLDVLSTILDREELVIHTLRSLGYTSIEICSKLQISLDYYTLQHNNIEEKIHRLIPIPDEPFDHSNYWQNEDEEGFYF